MPTRQMQILQLWGRRMLAAQLPWRCCWAGRTFSPCLFPWQFPQGSNKVRSDDGCRSGDQVWEIKMHMVNVTTITTRRAY